LCRKKTTNRFKKEGEEQQHDPRAAAKPSGEEKTRRLVGRVATTPFTDPKEIIKVLGAMKSSIPAEESVRKRQKAKAQIRKKRKTTKSLGVARNMSNAKRDYKNLSGQEEDQISQRGGG